ncbi:hypothetical protein HK105_206586 [Polyrhizophydium stewartii]|uniref:C3H1-type domain-containing protein n=1 Tax=Polyrhizophydium stewartii TaxID=2732419 RepID=A0ABR4N2X0_9FUNG
MQAADVTGEEAYLRRLRMSQGAGAPAPLVEEFRGTPVEAMPETGETRIVVLTNLVGRDEADEELCVETQEECARFGSVLLCVAHESKDPSVPDSEAVRVFVEFETLEGAITGPFVGMRTRGHLGLARRPHGSAPMIFGEEAVGELKAFLVAELDAIERRASVPSSDADAAVLADYVIALLRHDKPAALLKDDCLTELEDFLAEETAPFVERLFAALGSGRFAGAAAAALAPAPAPVPVPAAAPPVAAEAPAAPVKAEAAEPAEVAPAAPAERADSHMDASLAAKRPRDAEAARAPRGDERPDKLARTGNDRRLARDHERDRDRDRDVDRGRDLDRGRDRDGWAPRGAAPAGRPRGQCHSYRDKGYCMRGETCPYEHGPGALLIDHPAAPRPAAPPIADVPRITAVRDGRDGRDSRGPPRARAESRTLCLQNVPPESCTLDSINRFFKAFGTLTNIHVDPGARRAVIQFSRVDEAVAAFRSPDAIFGNRFVKVFFQRDDDQPGSGTGAGGYGAYAKPGSFPRHHAGGDAARDAEAAQQQALALAAQQDEARRQQEKTRIMLEFKKTQEALIAKQIEEQKRIMERLQTDKTMSAKDRKALMESLKTLTQRTKTMMENAASQAQQAKARAAAAAPTAAATPAAAASAPVAPAPPAPTSTAAAADVTAATAAPSGANVEADKAAAETPEGDAGTVTADEGADPALKAQLEALKSERPTRIALEGVTDDNEPALRKHFAAHAGLVAFERTGPGSAAAQFQLRWQAEVALASAAAADACAGVRLAWAQAPVAEA